MTNVQLTHDFFHSDKRDKRVNSMSYHDNSFYSYSTVIGVKDDVKKYFFMIEDYFSHTTSKHKSHLFRAVPHNYIILIVKDVYNLENNHDYFLARFNEKQTRFINPRCKDKMYDIQEMEKIRDKYIQYLDYLEIETHENLNIMNKVLELVKNPDAIAKLQAEFKENQLKRLQAERLQKATELQEFIDYERSYLNKHEHAYLRLKASEPERIETSKGYDLTVNEFKRLYKIFKTNKENLLSESVNKQINISSFTDKSIIVGCHNILFSEIERFNSLIS